ncbi:MAG: cohesin domain-containing protein [Candidatus Daviesbacteria bacterium]|nr:cohesin domain-containing protein [Candidatus Daviesbacteria bacterium]
MKKVKSLIITFFAFFLMVTPVYGAGASLSLSPSTGTFNPGCSFTVSVKLDTGGAQTDGTDAILLYNPSQLTTTSASIASGTIYPDYPGNNVDSQNGKITISGLASVSSAFAGQGTLATIAFTVNTNATAGPATVKFDFDPADKAKTTDSNIVERGTVSDILSSTVDGNYTIGTGTSCAAGGKGGVSSTPSGQLKNLDQAVGGKTGSEQLTFTVAIVGSVLTVLGILGLALL